MRRFGAVRQSTMLPALLVAVVLAAGCGDATGDESGAGPSSAPETETESGQADDGAVSEESPDSSAVVELFPDVLEATAVKAGDGRWTFSATLSSPYDTPERYADGWRVVGPDGTVYGTRPLAHDHQSEQPFTRSQSGIEIPAGVTEVTVQGRDQLSGWGGKTATVRLDG